MHVNDRRIITFKNLRNTVQIGFSCHSISWQKSPWESSWIQPDTPAPPQILPAHDQWCHRTPLGSRTVCGPPPSWDWTRKRLHQQNLGLYFVVFSPITLHQNLTSINQSKWALRSLDIRPVFIYPCLNAGQRRSLEALDSGPVWDHHRNLRRARWTLGLLYQRLQVGAWDRQTRGFWGTC